MMHLCFIYWGVKRIIVELWGFAGQCGWWTIIIMTIKGYLKCVLCFRSLWSTPTNQIFVYTWQIFYVALPPSVKTFFTGACFPFFTLWALPLQEQGNNWLHYTLASKIPPAVMHTPAKSWRERHPTVIISRRQAPVHCYAYTSWWDDESQPTERNDRCW